MAEALESRGEGVGRAKPGEHELAVVGQEVAPLSGRPLRAEKVEYLCMQRHPGQERPEAFPVRVHMVRDDEAGPGRFTFFQDDLLGSVRARIPGDGPRVLAGSVGARFLAQASPRDDIPGAVLQRQGVDEHARGIDVRRQGLREDRLDPGPRTGRAVRGGQGVADLPVHAQEGQRAAARGEEGLHALGHHARVAGEALQDEGLSRPLGVVGAPQERADGGDDQRRDQGGVPFRPEVRAGEGLEELWAGHGRQAHAAGRARAFIAAPRGVPSGTGRASRRSAAGRAPGSRP